MKPCKEAIHHLSRVEGQIKTLKKKIEEEHDCQEVMQLALASFKSFKSFNAKLLEEYIKHEFVNSKKVGQEKLKELEQIIKLFKS